MTTQKMNYFIGTMFKLLALGLCFCSASLVFFNPAFAQSQPSATSANYKDWVVRCRNIRQSDAAAQVQQICEMIHLVRIAARPSADQSQQPARIQTQVLAQMAIGKLPNEPKTKAVIQVPINVNLRSPIVLRLAKTVEEIEFAEDKNLMQMSYFTCQASGCLADIELSRGIVEAFFDAEVSQFSFADTAGRTINVPLSLAGFKDAYRAITK